MTQHPSWDHKTPLATLVAEHNDCLLDPNYKPHEDDDECLMAGSVLLPQGHGGYITLAYAKRGWMYVADTWIGDGRLSEYTPMPTQDAMRLVEATAISIRA